MRDVQASEPKTYLPQLLDYVERGETVASTRHGRLIASIVPAAALRQAEIDGVIAAIQALRKRTDKVAVEELLPARHEIYRR